MTTFSAQIIADKAVFFNSSELGKTVSLNTVNKVGVIVKQGNIEDVGMSYSYDFLDIVFSSQDISSISYKTDKLVVDGVTWGFPKLIDHSPISFTLRFRRNEKPLMTAGRTLRGS